MKTTTTAPTVSRLAACALALLLGAAVQAQPMQTPDWQRSTPGTLGVGLVLDATDNATVAGVASPSVYDAGVGTLVLSRHASNGTLQWTRSWNDGAVWLGTDFAGLRVRSVATDAAGSAFVVGDLMMINRSISLGTGLSTIVGVAPYGWLALKFGADGSLLWTSRQIAGSNWVGVRALADAAGDLYVLVDPGSAGMTMRTMKISGATGATLWTRSTPDGAKPGRLAISSRGNVTVSMASRVFGLSLVEYDAATGTELSRTAYPAAAGYYAPGLAVGPAGEFVVSGTSADGSATFVAAQDANHVPVFEKTFAQSASSTLVSVDAAGTVLVGGQSGGADVNWVTLRLDRLGNLLQAPAVVNRAAGANELPRDLVAGSSGGAFVAGAAGVPGSALPTATQATTVRYAADGSLAWLAATPAATTVVDAAAGRDGSVFVLGDSAQTLLHYPAAVAVPLPVPQAVTLARSTVRGGGAVSGGVAVSSKAGVVISLTSSHPAIASVPASITVPVGAATAGFTVRTARTRTTTAVTITATANGTSASTVLSVLR